MKIQIRFSLLLSVVALVAALGGVAGAVATVKIGSKQIKDGSVKSIDLRNEGVRSADLKDNGVDAVDLAPESVEGEALDLPGPTQCHVAGASTIEPTLEFQKVAAVCSATKGEAGSALVVTWGGSAVGHNGGEAGPCTFQLRVNGAPAAQGGGETIVQGVGPANATAIFTGVAAGPVTVEVWAKVGIETGIGNECSVGAGGIEQTVDVEEAVS